ncbi:MAG: GDP-mannose 4,6-dehydratase [Nanoarchaeota archaeon]|nr:GDP-mannose 4,6-dehydratase [Nanoarchaeota archaeon]
MDWKEKNVFITGADGFIGGWLTKVLVEKGANVIVIVRDMKKKSALDLHGIKDKVTVVQGDIIDYELVLRALNENDVEYVFHLAAQAIVGVASRSPLSTFESNIKGTWTILEAARNVSTIKGVIVASSDKAYGDQDKLPYTEDQPLLGLYPYDASKACADILARSYVKSYGLSVAVTRNANTYGGADMNISRIVPDTVISSLQGKELIIRSDGTLERDYMYIKDAVDAYLTLAASLAREDIKGQAFNFGAGKPVSVLDLFKLIIRLTGREIEPKITGKATNEIDKQYLSVEKVQRLLNWSPQYSLEEGLKETIEWYKEFLANNC